MNNPDMILIGAGIMSATLAIFLKDLQHDITIKIYERLDKPASKSSEVWNNAGNGNSVLQNALYTQKKYK